MKFLPLLQAHSSSDDRPTALSLVSAPDPDILAVGRNSLSSTFQLPDMQPTQQV